MQNEQGLVFVRKREEKLGERKYHHMFATISGVGHVLVSRDVLLQHMRTLCFQKNLRQKDNLKRVKNYKIVAYNVNAHDCVRILYSESGN